MEKDNSNIKKTFFEFFCVLPSYLNDLWSWFCFEKGALGIQTIEESVDETQLRIFFDKRPVGGSKKLVDIFEIKISNEKKIKILDEKVRSLENWQANWYKHFSPIKIGKTLIILPSWRKNKKLFRRNPVFIYPGQTFGTGHHVSTILALEKLEKYLLSLKKLPETMIDIGIGSGILSIAACRLGVKNVKGIDIDEKSIEEVKKNIFINEINGKIESFVGRPSLISDSSSLVICNMLLSEILSVKFVI